MISQEEMLDIICTEAIEGLPLPSCRPGMAPRSKFKLTDEPTCQYELRLVRMPDGTLKWED